MLSAQPNGGGGKMEAAQSIEQLWVEGHREVTDFLERRSGDRELAEELAAETFLHAAIAVQSGRSVSVGWLMTVAKRRLMDHWRASYRRDELVQRIANEPQRLELQGADDPFLGEALNRLCESQRSALLLRYCNDRSVQQVADCLELTYMATESLLSRGRRRLAGEYQAAIARI